MIIEEAIELVRRKWDDEGECASCGWHALLSEYDDLEDEIEINEREHRVELRCLNKDDDDRSDHRGVFIYFDRPASSGGDGQ